MPEQLPYSGYATGGGRGGRGGRQLEEHTSHRHYSCTQVLLHDSSNASAWLDNVKNAFHIVPSVQTLPSLLGKH